MTNKPVGVEEIVPHRRGKVRRIKKELAEGTYSDEELLNAEKVTSRLLSRLRSG